MLLRLPALAAVLSALLAAGLPVVPAAAVEPAEPFVSEIHYDDEGTDSGEFVEVQLPPGTTTQAWQVVRYNGTGGAVYTSPSAPALPPVTAPSDGPAVAVLDYPVNGLQNGSPDGLALVRPDGTVAQFLSYEGVFTAVGGPADGMTSTDLGVAEGSSTPDGWSLQLRLDPATGQRAWQPPAPATRGQVNPPLPSAPAASACDAAPTHEIGAVQGSGASTPLAGQTVTVRGVVVGDLPGLSGYHLQDADGDGDPATSDGVFVAGPLAVDLGDVVTVTGQAGERFGQTQIAATAAEVCGTAVLPAAAPLDLPADDVARERLEGMLVQPADTLTVSEVFDLTRFGELTLSEGGRLVQPTELARPGTAEAAAIAAGNRLRSIVLDDGSDTRRSATDRPYLSPATPVRVGDELTFSEPLVLGYGFSAFRLQPADGTADGVFAPQDTRPAAPEPVGGDVQVAAFNVLNYFLTFGGVGRGARSPEQLERQAAKIVPAIRALDADVVTLMEIEDTDSTGHTPGNADVALQDLVRRLDEAEGNDVWAYVPLPAELYAVERDVIRNAIVYRADVVEPVGDPVGLVDESVWSNAREPIAQTFAEDGDAFTVVANHFKSKSPGSPIGDNVDSGDGQGAWNGDRVRQARSLAAFAARLAERDPDVLLLGDLNAYSQEDPVEVLREAGYSSLGERLDPGRYSYVFDDESGSLDHAMSSPSLTPKVTDLAHWSINAVESFAYQYSGDPALYAADAYRSSDHDPIVLGLDLVESCDGLEPTLVGTEGDDVLRAGNGADVVMGLGGDDVVEGMSGDDVVCGGSGDDVLRGGNGADVLLGGPGDDVLDGGNGDDRLVGGPGDDDVRQGRGSDAG